MGNVKSLDPRALFEGGYLFIQTENPYYYPGDQVKGTIFIRTERPMHANKLVINFKGKEKVKYWWTDGKHMHLAKNKNKLFKHS